VCCSYCGVMSTHKRHSSRLTYSNTETDWGNAAAGAAKGLRMHSRPTPFRLRWFTCDFCLDRQAACTAANTHTQHISFVHHAHRTFKVAHRSADEGSCTESQAHKVMTDAGDGGRLRYSRTSRGWFLSRACFPQWRKCTAGSCRASHLTCHPASSISANSH
jgi:hypothetical protein